MKKIAIGLSAFYIIVMAFSLTSLMLSCGPSREELELKYNNKLKNTPSGKSILKLHSESYARDVDAQCYVGSNGCDYIGVRSYNQYEIVSHDGQCRKCKADNIRLMDSIVKSNLREIFGTCVLKKK